MRSARLSFGQERFWFLERLAPGNAVYHLPVALRLRGRLDLDALRRALGAVVAAHESLRTRFVEVAGTAYQVVEDTATIPLRMVGAGSEGELTDLLHEEVRAPFELGGAPLARALLVRLAQDHHVLLVTMHHIVSDAVSLRVFLDGLAAAYGGAAVVTGTGPQYADFAEWQRERLSGPAAEQHLAFWREHLAAAPEVLELPADRVRPAVQSYRGATHRFDLDPGLVRDVEEVGARHGATPYMALLAGFVTLLHRYTGQVDIVVGTPAANRAGTELAGVIGFFVNTLVLRTRLDGDPSFAELVRRVRRTALACYEHAELPFEKLVDELSPARDLSRSPVVQVLFALHDAASLAVPMPGLLTEPVPLDSSATQFDLVLTIERTGRGPAGVVEYSTDLFDAGTIERVAAHLKTLLAGAVAEPDRPVSQLPIAGSAEAELLAAFNDTGRDHPRGRPVHELIEEQARRTPDARAVVDGRQELTYAELNRRANRLARHLVRHGIGAETPVAIAMPRTAELPVALLAVLKAGGAYLPVDPSYPETRRAFMLADSGAQVVLTGLDGLELGGLPDDDLGVRVPAGSPAYLIYTSGSTGTPKGVAVPHGALTNFVHAMDGHITAGPGSVWLATTSVSFDIAALELLWTLARGVTVVVREDLRAAPATAPVDFSLFYFASSDTDGSPELDAGAAGRYRLLLDGARYADQHGFAAVWTPERHFHPFGGPYPNPAVTGAAVAAVTDRIAVRAGSVVLPLQDPLRVAEEWAVVDGLSGGRAEVSFASGWLADDFVLAPDNHADRKRIMTEGIETVRALWRGEAVKRVNGAGRHIEVRTHPRPVRPELPVWLTSAGDPATFEAAGAMGADLLTHLLGQDLDELAGKIRRYRGARAAAGHRGRGRVALMVHTHVDSDPDVVRERAREPFVAYLRSSLGLIKNLLDTPLDLETLPRDELDALLRLFYDRYFDRAGLFGSPQSCQPMVERIVAAGVDEIACLVDFGIDPELVLASLPQLDTLRRNNSRYSGGGDDSVAAQLRRHGVTHLQCTPSLATALAGTDSGLSALAGLRQLVVGGEAFGAALAARLEPALPGRLLNMYGPTETTIWSTVQHVAGEDSPPIGAPVANTRVYLVDPRGQPVPIGVPGEVLIGGAGVARGYWRRPALTAERFVPDPFGPPGERLYRTGDLAVLRADGTLEFRGRLDDQVKLRGHRVELGEIEAHLEADPAVDRAVVCVAAPGTDRAHLVGYVRLRGNPATTDGDPELVALPSGGVLAVPDRRSAAELYREIFLDEEYLDGFLRLWDGATVIDAGANVGAFTLFVHRRCRPGRVIAVEPIPPTFERLRRTVRANGIDATLVRSGLAAEPGTAAFTHYPELIGLSGRYADPEADRRRAAALLGTRRDGSDVGGMEDVEEFLAKRYRSERFDCQLTTLSQLISTYAVDRVDLLKVDVERAELDVLAGLSEADWAKVAQVCVEVEGNDRRDDVIDLLRRRGFEVHTLPLLAELEVAIVHARRPDLPDLPATATPAGAGPAGVSPDPAALRERLTASLPGHLVPDRVVAVAEFPMTPNGKVDRRALATMPAEPARTSGVEAVPPSTPVERQLAGVWREVLGLPEVGVHENFFDAGGNSLLLIKVHARIAELDLRTPRLVELFAHPTIAGLAAHLRGSEAGREEDLESRRSGRSGFARRRRETATERST